MDINKDMQEYIDYYNHEKRRIPVNIAKYKKEVDVAEKELQTAIAAGDKRLIYGYSDILKQNKRDLSYYEEMSSFLREPNEDDIRYREHQEDNFPKKIKQMLSDDMAFCFHGTGIVGAKNILLSGEISSGADRTGHATSFDPPGRISVTNKDTVDTSVGIYMGMNGSGYCYPAGCLFVLLPQSKAEYDALSGSGWMIKNVNFKENSDRLVAVVTTPENIERVQGWAKKGGVDVSKVMDFDAFVLKYSSQNDKGLSLVVKKNVAAKRFDKSQ